jgi:hypothetical protein
VHVFDVVVLYSNVGVITCRYMRCISCALSTIYAVLLEQSIHIHTLTLLYSRLLKHRASYSYSLARSFSLATTQLIYHTVSHLHNVYKCLQCIQSKKVKKGVYLKLYPQETGQVLHSQD